MTKTTATINDGSEGNRKSAIRTFHPEAFFLRFAFLQTLVMNNVEKSRFPHSSIREGDPFPKKKNFQTTFTHFPLRLVTPSFSKKKKKGGLQRTGREWNGLYSLHRVKVSQNLE